MIPRQRGPVLPEFCARQKFQYAVHFGPFRRNDTCGAFVRTAFNRGVTRGAILEW